MKKTAIKWLKEAAFGLMIPPLLLATMATAMADSHLPEVEISKNSLEHYTINPDENEELEISYCIESPSYVTTGIYKATGDDSSDKVDILEDRAFLLEGCYDLYWDGKHGEESEINDRPEQVKDGKYFYGITARAVENQSQGDDYVSEWFYVETDDEEVEIEDLDVDNSTFDPEDGEEVEFTFELNRDAYVTLLIKDEDGDTVRELLDEKRIDGGEEYEVEWDGEDDDDDLVPDGEYTYKLIAEYNDEKDTKKGEIEVDTDGRNSTNYSRNYSNSSYCAVFNDVYDNYVKCDAIDWAYNQGILKGYSDGTFRPERAISRAEAMKMVMEAFDINPYSGGNLIFSDVSSNDWYSQYLGSATTLGIVHGYPDGTFKPNREVSRVEALVMILNAAKVKDGIILSTSQKLAYMDTPYVEDTMWYYSYARFAQANDLTDNDYFLYPEKAMTRSEMADMLYRYSNL